MIEDYVMHIKKNINPNTVPSYVYPLKLFFDSNDVDLKWRKIKKLFPAPVKITGDTAYSTADIQKMLESTPILKNKALIHFLASTGCRIGALSDLQLRHIIQMPHNCKAIQVYEDSIEEYYTFLTPEASNVLDEYLEQRRKDNECLTPESPVFRTKYALGVAKSKSLTKKAMQAIIDRALRNANIRHFSEKRNGRYKTQLDHGFRKRFDTILKLNKNVNDNIIEKMMGHKKGLDGVYLKPTLQEMFEEFKAGIIDLTIDDSERLRLKNEKLEKEKSELQKLEKRIEELEYGKQPREAEFLKRHFEIKDQPGKSLLETIFYLWFEMRASEDEKRKIWKKIQQANEKGKKLELTKFFGESGNLSLKNYYSVSTS